MIISDVLRANVSRANGLGYNVIEIQVGEENFCELRSEFCALGGFSSILTTTSQKNYREDKFMGIPIKSRAELGHAIVLIVERPISKYATFTSGEQQQKKFCPYCGERLQQ